MIASGYAYQALLLQSGPEETCRRYLRGIALWRSMRHLTDLFYQQQLLT